jgi:iron complex transport system ATP-binding protein
MSALLELAGAKVLLGGRLAVAEVTFRVDRGEVVALLGANGAGKTTLIRAALGLTPLNAGAARLGDADPVLLSARERALRAAYLPQRPQSIWPVSVEALVALGRYAYGAAPDRLGERDQAAVDAALGACALDSLRKRRMDEISGGEKARAHLARALAQQAPLLVLDEPTAGLDPAQALAVGDILRRHGETGGGVLVSMHDIGLAARAATSVLVLHQGRMLAQGAPESALTPDVIGAAYGREGRIERLGEAMAVVFK